MTLNELTGIAWRALKKTLASGIGRYFFGGFGSTAAAVFFMGNAIRNISGWFYNCVVIVFIITLLALLYRFFKFITNGFKEYYHNLFIESFYGEVIIMLKDAFSHIHFIRKVPNATNEQISASLLAICNSVRDIFSKKTNNICSVSIKIPLQGSLDLSQQEKAYFTEAVRNLCRDSAAISRDNPVYMSTRHSIAENTAFHQVVLSLCSGGEKKFYSNNDIKNTRDYNTTSKTSTPGGNLSYNSELVFPIIPILPTESEKNKIAGFLTVDCISNFNFGDKYDIAIMEGVADGLYDVILKSGLLIKKIHNYEKD